MGIFEGTAREKPLYMVIGIDTICKPIHNNIGVAMAGICISMYDAVHTSFNSYTPVRPMYASLHWICMVIWHT